MSNPELDFAREQQDKQIANDPSSLYADSMREEKVNNLLQQINPDNILVEIEHRIRGEKKTIDGWKPISDTQTPISDLLVSDFISFLGSILNQNTSMSNYTQHEINNIMELISDWVRGHFVVNAEAYGIEGNYSEYDRIGYIIMNNCWSVFKRALGGRESQRIFKIMRVTENNQPNKRGGVMDHLNFWS